VGEGVSRSGSAGERIEASELQGTLRQPPICNHRARIIFRQESDMAERRKRRYSRSAGTDVEKEMHRYKRGTAKSGPGGRGGKVKSRKQAIAIGLSKARKKGKKVPRKK
jgi:Family of unknown function (DUF6496)